MDKLKRVKKDQKINLIMGIVFSILAITAFILDKTNVLKLIDSTFIAALVGGACGALGSYFNIKKNLKDTNKTEEYINNKFDERNLTIELHSAQTTFNIVGYVGLIVAGVFAYINETIFLTIMWTLVVSLIIYLICYAYYKKKY